MKNSIILLLSILFTSTLFAQKWDHIFGTPDNTETVYDVLESYDKGYLISGSYKIPNYSNWLIKTDVNGEILWDKVITHDNFYSVNPGALSQNSFGEIVLARGIALNQNKTWPSLIKLDTCGNKLWCRVYIDDNYMHGAFQDVILFDNGDVLALGWLESPGETDKIFLYYIDPNGNLLWRKSYASKDDHPLLMSRLPNGLHKFGNEYMIHGRCYYPYPENPGTGYKRPLYISIDSLFNEKWILPFGVSSYIIGNAYDVIQLNDSVYMGAGVDIGSELNSLFMYFNSDGEEIGASSIPNEAISPDIYDNTTGGISRINDTLFISSTIFGYEEYGDHNMGELIIDTAGNIYHYGTRPNTEGNGTLIKTYDDKYVIGCNYKHSGTNYDIYLYKINDSLEFDTVYTANYTYDSLCPGQIESGTIDVSDCLLITDVGETPSPEEYYAGLNTILVKAYPNPATEGEITFEYQNTGHHRDMELRCFNMFGEEVYSEKVYPYQGESKINIRDWQSGIYVGLVYSNGQVVGRTKFVIK